MFNDDEKSKGPILRRKVIREIPTGDEFFGVSSNSNEYKEESKKLPSKSTQSVSKEEKKTTEPQKKNSIWSSTVGVLGSTVGVLGGIFGKDKSSTSADSSKCLF